MGKYSKTMAEALKDVYMPEGNMDLMRKAASGSAQDIKMKDGKLKVDSFTASAIIQIYDKVNKANQRKMESMINSGRKADVMKLSNFAMSKINSEYVPEELQEGTWKVPETKIDQMALRKTLRKPIKAKDAEKVMSQHIGDDSLYDEFAELEKDDPNQDVRPLIRNRMKELGIKEEVELDEGTYRIGNMKKSGNFKAKNAEDAIKQAIKKGIKVDREFTVYDRDKREFIYKNDKPAVATKGTYKEEVDLDEGKMNQMHQMMKDGKTAAQIAKALKLDLKTVKALMDSYNKMVPESFEIGTEKYLKHTVETTPGQKEWTETVTKKASSMRETLAKVWEADVGKSPFQKNAKEDLTKGVKGGKTMTGKKVAAIDTKPTIKEKKK